MSASSQLEKCPAEALVRDKLARYMPELLILIKGLMVAARSVFFTLVLLLLITYVFSIAFSELSEASLHMLRTERAFSRTVCPACVTARARPCQGTNLEKFFPSMPASLLTLVVKSVMPDREVFFREVARESWFMGALDARLCFWQS